MEKAKCVFCKLFEEKEKNKDDIFHESVFFYSKFDRYPVTPGHAEIIAKRHVVSLLELTEEEWLDLKKAIPETINTIKNTNLFGLYNFFVDNPLDEKSKKFCGNILDYDLSCGLGVKKDPDGYNIGINEGRAAGRTIDHLHIHVIPRYFGDVPDPVGGIRHIIPGKGNYKK